MSNIVHGKLIFRELIDSDLIKLQEFCDRCKELNYHNNIDLKAIKYDKMVMPYGKFYAGFDIEKDIIFTLAGIHRLPEINDKAWRCMFRGAQLKGYNYKFSKNMFDLNFHFSQILNLQITDILKDYPDSEFYVTTNILDDNNGTSSRMNKIMMPYVEKTNIWNLYQSDISLYNTRQNVYKINVNEYFNQRELWIKSQA